MNGISDETRLAFSMAENPGVYALVLGSGISRSAGIPTGWEITIDLVRRVAAAEGIVDEADWAGWHRTRFGIEPGYSDLLDRLTTVPAERRSIVQGYIEPPVDDLDAASRRPTPAHRAIAGLVRDGWVRVIVTTNFDRLLETALTDAGIQPVVIRSVDDLAGAPPLQHARCLVLKLHGDYLDDRILNTDAELAGYPAEYDRLLDRVLDEYGLVVAGWSGDWDPALRAAIARAPNRRYPQYWAMRGAPSRVAAELIANRGASVVPIVDADAFFTDIAASVTALTAARRSSPDTIQLLIARTKRDLSGREGRIDVADAFAERTQRLIERIAGPEFPVQGGSTGNDAVLARWRSIEGLSGPLARMIGVAGRWGDRTDAAIARDVVRSIMTSRASSGSVVLIGLSTYPAYLCTLTYALGLAKAERWADLLSWFRTEIPLPHRVPSRIVDKLFMQFWSEVKPDAWNLWTGSDRNQAPWADHLADSVVPWSQDLGMTSAAAMDNFHLVELLGGLVYLESSETEYLAALSRANYMPFGQTGWMAAEDPNLYSRLGLERLKPELLRTGFCKGSEPHWVASMHNLKLIAAHLGW